MEVKLETPDWLNEIIIAITSTLDIEPSRLVKSIIISVLLVAVIAAVVAVISMLRSWLNHDKQPSNDHAEAKIHALSQAIKPTSAEYERMINDAIETALLPVFRRIKRLEEQVFHPSEERRDTVAQSHNIGAAQLYDDVQDVVLPSVVDEEAQAQETTEPALSFPEEEVEHTTVAQVQDTGLQPVPPREENNEHTAVSQVPDSGQQEASEPDDAAPNHQQDAS